MNSVLKSWVDGVDGNLGRKSAALIIRRILDMFSARQAHVALLSAEVMRLEEQNANLRKTLSKKDKQLRLANWMALLVSLTLVVAFIRHPEGIVGVLHLMTDVMKRAIR